MFTSFCDKAAYCNKLTHYKINCMMFIKLFCNNKIKQNVFILCFLSKMLRCVTMTTVKIKCNKWNTY